MARILVVDDVDDNRYTLTTLLDLEGYSDVVTANDGAEALERLAAERFDLVLLDVMMPRLDGYGVLQALKAQNRLHELPVIMISALTEMDSVVRCIELGADDYLPKPFNATLLKARIRATLEKKKLHDRVREQLERTERELEFARELQLGMVPAQFAAPTRERPVEIAAALHPARNVGGDFYDVFDLPGGRLALIVADVSDKGVAAALFMARAISTLRLLAGGAAAPGEILARANADLCRSNLSTMFVTVWLGALDPASGELAFANAGHAEPLRAIRGDVAPLSGPRGRPLAVRADASYETGVTRLRPGETLLGCTDGVTEAFDLSDQAFGEKRLREHLAKADGTPAALVASVAAEVRRFTGKAPQSDDIALLALRWMPRS